MNREEATSRVDELFESWYAQMVRYAWRLTGQPPSAEEIVQDTFLDLYRALRAGQEIRHPKAWTMSVVRRKAYDRRREPFGVDAEHEPLEGPNEAAEDWSERLQTAIDSQRVRDCLALLSVREEEVLLLRLESLKYREIAQTLGISINSVNTLLARALGKMQRALGGTREAARKSADA